MDLIGCLISGIIIGGAALSLGWQLRLQHNVRKELQTARKTLPTKPVKRLEHLSAVEPAFGQLLQPHWITYRKAVGQSSWDSGLPSPADFFDYEKVVDSTCHRRVAELVPGILTALGILGTFIGLVQGLNEFDAGSLSNVEGLLESISPLLEGMQTAFWTSIIGIVASLIWSLADRLSLRAVTKELFELQGALDSLFLPIIETSLLDRLVTVQREQYETLRDFVTNDFLPRLVQGIGQTIDQSLGEKMQHTVKALEHIGERTGQQHTDSIDRMVTGFVDGFNEALGGQVQDLAHVLRDTVEWQRSVKLELSDLLDKIQDTAERQNEGLEASQDLADQLAATVDVLSGHLEQIESGMQALAGLLGPLGEAQANLIEQINVVRDMQQAWEDRLQELSAVTADWKGVAGQVQAAAAQFGDQVGTELQASIERMHAGYQSTFSAFDNHLSQATKTLGSVVQAMDEQINDLPRVIEQMRKRFDDFNKTVSFAVDSLTEAAADLRRAHEVENVEPGARQAETGADHLLPLEEGD